MREKLTRFMYGRYGNDALGRFMIAVCLISIVVSMFTHLQVFYLIGLVLLIWSYIRIFSKNIPKRYQENQKYLAMTAKIRNYFRIQKSHFAQRNQYRFYHCPQCRQSIRVPKGRGKIAITCPKCKLEFIKKS